MAPGEEEDSRPLYQMMIYFAMMVGVLVFANWAKPAESSSAQGLWASIYSIKWVVTSGFAAALAVVLILWFKMSWWKIALAAVPAWEILLTQTVCCGEWSRHSSI
jgi:hypothetical protein